MRGGYRRQGELRCTVAAAALLLCCATAPPASAQDPAQAPPDQGAESSIVLLFDSSGSMRALDGTGTRRIDRAKSAIRALLEGPPPGARIGLRVFGGRFPREEKARGCQDSRLLLPVGPVDRDAAEQALDQFTPLGYTPIALSLRRAAEDLPPDGRRTIILVSDGQETCGPPPPCEVAAEVARRGVELKIQAIGFQVNRQAREQLRCIARVGGGVYRDVQDAPRLAEELRALSVRALRAYVPEGQPVEGGDRPGEAAEVGPGQWLDSIGPDEERWYAVELDEGETLQAATTLVAERRRDLATIGADFTLDILTPKLQEITLNNTQAATGSTLFDPDSEGGIDSIGVTGRPVAVGDQEQAAGGEPTEFGEPGRYYLRIRVEDNDSKELFTKLGGEPVPLELLVNVLGREGGEGSRAGAGGGGTGGGPDPGDPKPGTGAPTDDDDEASALVIAVVGALALAAGLAASLALLRRGRPA